MQSFRILDYNVKKSMMRLVKTYDIDLCGIFLQVLEPIIREYVNDIVEVDIKFCRISGMDGHIITVNNQSIEFKNISFVIHFKHIGTPPQIRMRIISCDCNIAIINEDNFSDFVFPCTACINEYTYRNFSTKYYVIHGDHPVEYKHNVITFNSDTVFLRIIIKDKMLFEQMIFITKCVKDDIEKNND